MSPPTRPQRYCDPVSFVLLFLHSLSIETLVIQRIEWTEYFNVTCDLLSNPPIPTANISWEVASNTFFNGRFANNGELQLARNDCDFNNRWETVSK